MDNLMRSLLDFKKKRFIDLLKYYMDEIIPKPQSLEKYCTRLANLFNTLEPCLYIENERVYFLRSKQQKTHYQIFIPMECMSTEELYFLGNVDLDYEDTYPLDMIICKKDANVPMGNKSDFQCAMKTALMEHAEEVCGKDNDFMIEMFYYAKKLF